MSSYCGINCKKCPVFIATEEGQINKLAEERKMSIEDVTCNGCFSEVNTVWCRVCSIKICAKTKGVKHCYIECREYPCEDIYLHTNVPVFQEDSYCGLYCGACELFIATKENRLSELASERNMSVDDLECYGCKSKKTSIYCGKCEIKNCNLNISTEFCCNCDEFPCIKIKNFSLEPYSHKNEVIENLDYIGNSGKQNWIEKQKEKWSCKVCGTRFSFYSNNCRVCGSKVGQTDLESERNL